MAVWQAVQEAGEALRRKGEPRREAFFNKGDTPRGKERTSKLYIEADGMVIKTPEERKEKRSDTLWLTRAKRKSGVAGRL
ncbi:hypothetical protein [Brockia lithotrophica]|uniref:hypothetical protein n=1 Tax=Brockia lithotrophica TaxID=933949 RepID=UPI0011C3E9A1|nr:hypothetical protein [Brockia lithotrophica]